MFAQKVAYGSLSSYLKSVYANAYFSKKYVDSVTEANTPNSVNKLGTNPPPPNCCNAICITGTFSLNAPGGWCGTQIPGGGTTSGWTYSPIVCTFIKMLYKNGYYNSY